MRGHQNASHSIIKITITLNFVKTHCFFWIEIIQTFLNHEGHENAFHSIIKTIITLNFVKKCFLYSEGCFPKGKILAWDHTCRNTLANSYKKHTAVEVGYAAMDGKKDKYDNYKESMKIIMLSL